MKELLGEIKKAVDKIMSLPGPMGLKEEALVELNVICVLGSSPKEMDAIEEFHSHVRGKGVTLECFAPTAAAFIR